jgi:hypothetical protein
MSFEETTPGLSPRGRVIGGAAVLTPGYSLLRRSVSEEMPPGVQVSV